MKCDELKLSQYLDNELTPAEVAEVKSHLSGCPDCRNILQEWQRNDNELKSLGNQVTAQLTSSERLSHQIITTLNQSSTKADSGLGWKKRVIMEAKRYGWPIAAAAVILVAIVGLVIYQVQPNIPLGKIPATIDTKIFAQSEILAGSQAALRVVTVNYKDETPVPDARVTVNLVNKDNKSWRLFTGKTNRSGSVDCSFTVPELAPGDYEITVKTEGETTELEKDKSDPDLMKVNIIKVEKIAKYPVKLKRAYAIYLSTDKPIYQPSQEMHIRALALHKTTLKPIGDKPIIMEVVDPRGNKVMKKNLKTSEFGIGSVIFSLADEINLGNYTVRALLEDDPAVEKTVTVDKYILPRFKITFTTDKKYYRPKETVKCSLKSDYTYGKPVVSARVLVRAFTFDTSFREFGKWEGTTDQKGATDEFTFTLPDYFVGQPLLQGKGMVKFEVSVVDDTDHKEETVQTVTVAEAAINITVIPESGTIVPNLENTIYLAATYPDGSPVKNAKLWVETTKPGVKEKLKATPVLTDDLGIGSIKVTPMKDEITLKISAKDEKGNEASQVHTVSADPAAQEDGLLIRTDKSIYKVGETLTLSIFSTKKSGPVYVDFIKDKQTILTRTVDINNGLGTDKMELSSELFGVIEVNGYQIRKSLNIIRDTTRVLVNPANDLMINIKPDKETYLPGAEDVTVNFEVTDVNNHPVLAALGIWTVDEAVFARAEQDPGLARVFFLLEREVMKPRWEVHDWTLDDIAGGVKPPVVSEVDFVSKKQEAARVLFAATDEVNSIPVRISSREKEMEKELGEKVVKIYKAYADRLTQVSKGYPELTHNELKPLVTRGFVESEKEIQDPWGNNLVYTGNLVSFGPDKRKDTADDIQIFSGGFYLKEIYDRKTTAALFNRSQTITKAIAKYRAFFVPLTKDLHGLVDGEILKGEELLDPWGTKFIADPRNQCGCDDYPHGNDLGSAGADKQFGTGDDIYITLDSSLQTQAQLTKEQADDLKARAQKVLKAMVSYKNARQSGEQVTGDYSALYKKNLLKPEDTKDTWGHTIKWLNDQQLASDGKDGQPNTTDDLIFLPGNLIQVKELPDTQLSKKLTEQWTKVTAAIQKYYETRASFDLNLWVKEGLLKSEDTRDPWGYQLSFHQYYVLGHRPEAKSQTGPAWSVTYYVALQNDGKNQTLAFGQGDRMMRNELAGLVKTEMEKQKGAVRDFPLVVDGARGGRKQMRSKGPTPSPVQPPAKPGQEPVRKDAYDYRERESLPVPPGPKPWLRQDFRETLFVLPQLITDREGRARYTLPRLADNITNWRVSAFANSRTGQLGSTTARITAFQDFFIDIDLPVALTQNDEVSIPVIIKNYLKTPQKVQLVLNRTEHDWFVLVTGEDTRIIDLEPESGKSAYFRIRARDVGLRQAIQFTAQSLTGNFGDAVLRTVEVRPDGKEHLVTYSETLSTELSPINKTITIPTQAIEGGSTMFIKFYPGVFSQVLEGMEKILRMPSGCFEQTSSSTYPNILALDYLKSTKQSKPEIEMQARTFIAHGYQRLVSFEVPGGGFSWFGEAPANQVLTAYGLMEFVDMARVFDEVDPALIERTRNWLVSKQQDDGSWQPDQAYLHAEAWGRIQKKNLLVTAYITWSLAETGYKNEPLKKAINYIRSQVTSDKLSGLDPYTIGLCANALLTVNRDDKDGVELIKYLDGLKAKKDKTAYWSGQSTVTYATGESADIETTAVIALAIIKSGAYHETLREVLDFITQSKDPSGTWHSTQGTILALKALLASQSGQGQGKPINAEITIDVNGKYVAAEVVDPSEWDIVRTVDLRKYTQSGENNVVVKFAGQGAMMYQLVGRYYLPEPKTKPQPDPLGITVSYDRTKLATYDTVKTTVKVANHMPGPAKMVMIDLTLPPGFSLLDQTEFNELVASKKIAKFNLTARQVIIYLEELDHNKPLEFSYHLKAKYPVKVRVVPSRVYEYYNPSQESFSAPESIEVQ